MGCYLAAYAALFFSACEGWTFKKHPSNFFNPFPFRDIALITEFSSKNSTYAMPFEIPDLGSLISLISLIFPHLASAKNL
jgi:hypothetical protein